MQRAKVEVSELVLFDHHMTEDHAQVKRRIEINDVAYDEVWVDRNSEKENMSDVRGTKIGQ